MTTIFGRVDACLQTSGRDMAWSEEHSLGDNIDLGDKTGLKP